MVGLAAKPAKMSLVVCRFYCVSPPRRGDELTFDYGVSFWLAFGQRPSEGTDGRRELD